MINNSHFRETENVSSARKLTKERTVLKNKANALGDVQNTLHFRSGNFTNPVTNSAKKSSSKPAGFAKSASKENALSAKWSKLGVKIPTIPKYSHSALTDAELLDIHNHLLCEQAEDSTSDFLQQYKFTGREIDNLVKSVKRMSVPLAKPVVEYCPEIELPIRKCEERHFVVSDLFNDVIVPEVPAPPPVAM